MVGGNLAPAAWLTSPMAVMLMGGSVLVAGGQQAVGARQSLNGVLNNVRGALNLGRLTQNLRETLGARLNFKLPQLNFKFPRLNFQLPQLNFKLPRLNWNWSRAGGVIVAAGLLVMGVGVLAWLASAATVSPDFHNALLNYRDRLADYQGNKGISMAAAAMISSLGRGFSPLQLGKNRTQTHVGRIVQMQDLKAQASEWQELLWSIKTTTNREMFSARMEDLFAAFSHNELGAPDQTAAVVASFLAAAYQNPNMNGQLSSLWLPRLRQMMGNENALAANLAARASVDPEVIQVIEKQDADVQRIIMKLMNAPLFTLYAFDPETVTMQAYMARQGRITDFYQALESRAAQDRSDQGRRAVDYFRTHMVDDAELFDQQVQAEQEAQILGSRILFGLSQGPLGMRPFPNWPATRRPARNSSASCT